MIFIQFCVALWLNTKHTVYTNFSFSTSPVYSFSAKHIKNFDGFYFVITIQLNQTTNQKWFKRRKIENDKINVIEFTVY